MWKCPPRAGSNRWRQKNLRDIRQAMGRLRLGIDESKAEKKAPRFAPAGQSTQMIVGADASTDRDVLTLQYQPLRQLPAQARLLLRLQPDSRCLKALPLRPPPLVREHRLYQADWLMRFYGFNVEEIAPPGDNGMLDLDVDPKMAWALRHRSQFPVNLNTAPREMLLRVPGLGVRTVDKLLAIRAHRRIRYQDLAKLRVAVGKWRRSSRRWITALAPTTTAARCALRLTTPRQADLFGH